MKKLTMALLISTSLFLLAGCSPSDKDKTEYYKKHPQEAKKVTFQCTKEFVQIGDAIEKQADCRAVISATQEFCREIQKIDPRYYLGDMLDSNRTIADFDCNNRSQMLRLSALRFAGY